MSTDDRTCPRVGSPREVLGMVRAWAYYEVLPGWLTGRTRADRKMADAYENGYEAGLRAAVRRQRG